MKNIIWTSNIDPDEWEAMKVDYEGEEKSDQEIYEILLEENQNWLECEKENLDIHLQGSIFMIADLGLWDGRRTAYRFMESRNIADIMQYYCRGYSEVEFYFDGYNICGTETHHDGVNHYLFREALDEKELKRILTSKQRITNQILNRYTRSIGEPVAKIFGWCA